jgi:hypothetical protein
MLMVIGIISMIIQLWFDSSISSATGATPAHHGDWVSFLVPCLLPLYSFFSYVAALIRADYLQPTI